MYCMNSNLFKFLSQSNANNFNFFFFNNFNNFNFIIFKNFQIKNISKLTNKTIIFKKTFNLFFLKYYKFYNSVTYIKLNYINKNLISRYNGSENNVVVLNSYNLKFFKNFFNVLSNLSLNNHNFIALDNSYKNIIPLYNYIFGLKNITIYKNFFFFDQKKFTYPNWIRLYIFFLKKLNINLLVVLDYNLFKKFFKTLKTANLPISSLIPLNSSDYYVDYPLYFNINIKQIEKFILLNSISYSYFMFYNYNNYICKLNFLKLFYIFSNTIN